MRHAPHHGCQFFFTTTAQPCPYLEGRIERRVVTELAGRQANRLHDQLSLSGFRRSHGIAYVPACPDCNACLPVRIRVDGFTPSRSQRRVLAQNKDLTATLLPPVASDEQYALFSRYLSSRHADGDMANMDVTDYQSLVEDTPIDSVLIEFRDADETLVAVCLCDPLGDGFSAVYSFFEPTLDKRSLGTFMVLWLAGYAKLESKPYVYLGYWIEGSPKMAYKKRFQPLEVLQAGQWVLQTDTETHNENGLPEPG